MHTPTPRFIISPPEPRRPPRLPYPLPPPRRLPRAADLLDGVDERQVVGGLPAADVLKRGGCGARSTTAARGGARRPPPQRLVDAAQTQTAQLVVDALRCDVRR